jgi:hypothetical protein
MEGVCGLMLTPDRPRVNPLVPADWKWVALRRLPYHGQEVTYVAVRHDDHFYIYANADVQTAHHKERYDEDVSTQVHAFSASAEVVALRRSNELMVLIVPPAGPMLPPPWAAGVACGRSHTVDTPHG